MICPSEVELPGTITLHREPGDDHPGTRTWTVFAVDGRLVATCDDYDPFPDQQFFRPSSVFFRMLRRLYRWEDGLKWSYPLYAPADLPERLEPYVVAMALSRGDADGS